VVCDGFVGNVALKTSEGVARYIAQAAKEEVQRSLPRKVMALTAYPILNAMKTRFDPSRYNGALLVGLKGNVVKSHGRTSPFGFSQAVWHAVRSAEKNLANLIGNRLNQQV